MQREEATVEAMIRYYCRHQHNGRKNLCQECTNLLAYARKRLAHCPFQEGKTTCGNCQIHCYQPHRRQQIQEVMRFAGPRMLFAHPLLALHHVIDGFRKNPLPRKQ